MANSGGPEGSVLCFSSTRFIMRLCLLIKTNNLILSQNLQDLPVCIITGIDRSTLEWASKTGMDIKINLFLYK